MKYHYYYIQNFYSKSECLDIINTANNIDFSDMKDEPATGVVKTADVKIVGHGQLWHQLDKFRHMVYNINQKVFGFDLFQISKFDVIHINDYNESKKGEYGWHSDGCYNECRDIKLTALLNLSVEPFEGGDFEFFLSKEERINEFKEPGSLLVFPSWTQHRVLPVNKGNRKSLTCFVAGPLWK
jgi:Rps23 Pro-64 3,4-dihydroxylase Tpa1-like proline 4-hydroxylase